MRERHDWPGNGDRPRHTWGAAPDAPPAPARDRPEQIALDWLKLKLTDLKLTLKELAARAAELLGSLKILQAYKPRHASKR